MSEETKAEGRTTSADIKKQIDEATRVEKSKTSLKDSGLPLTGAMANQINASESTPKDPAKAEVKPDPVQPAAKGMEGSEAAKNAVDLQDWAKKRGIDWTTEESVLAALRKSDQAFHEKRAKEKTQANSNQTYPPAYPYPPQNGYPPPYVPQQPTSNRVVIEDLARQYGMLPEDVERLAKFNRDQYEAMIRAERERTQREFDAIRIENQKNSVFRELSSDPVFRRHDVAQEFHAVLEQMQNSDPQSFENPNAYRMAYREALANIGRRNLEGRPLSEGVPPTPSMVTPPTTPPRQWGQGSGGGSQENENQIDMKAWNKLDSKQKKEWFELRGLVSPKY